MISCKHLAKLVSMYPVIQKPSNAIKCYFFLLIITMQLHVAIFLLYIKVYILMFKKALWCLAPVTIFNNISIIS